MEYGHRRPPRLPPRPLSRQPGRADLRPFVDRFNPELTPTPRPCQTCKNINFGRASTTSFDDKRDHYLGAEQPLMSVLSNSDDCPVCGTIAQTFWAWHSQADEGILPTDFAYSKVVYAEIVVALDRERKQKSTQIHVEVQPYRVRQPKKASRSYQSVHLLFNVCDSQHLTVTDICAESTPLHKSRAIAGQGRVRPLVADGSLFHKWKECCHDLHRGNCNRSYTGDRPRWLRFIDVVDCCLVEQNPLQEWVALSYVWGSQVGWDRSLMPTKSNIETLLRPGSLSGGGLPKTIEDSMQVARDVGERYLWVDAFSILQDDEEEKLDFIEQMDSIFGWSYLTIVAASSTCSDDGLAGVRPQSRSILPHPLPIGNLSLLKSLETVESFEGRGDPWFTRGWTMQEGRMPRRMLIFDKEQIYWKCGGAIWCEDSWWEQSSFRKQSCPVPDQRALRGRSTPNFIGQYFRTVEEYTGRELTMESDILNAFAGILRGFERTYGEFFFWGLPVRHLPTSLMWKQSGDPLHCRRKDMSIIKARRGLNVRAPFPSWSWAGWQTVVDYNFNHGPEHDPLIEYYHIDTHGIPRPIFNRSDSSATRHTNCVWAGENRQIEAGSLPPNARRLPLNLTLLCCMTGTAELSVMFDGERLRTKLYEGDTMLDSTGFYFLDMPDIKIGRSDNIRFVALGAVDRGDCGDGDVPLMMTTVVDRIHYRRGVVRMKEWQWIELDRLWELVVLG